MLLLTPGPHLRCVLCRGCTGGDLPGYALEWAGDKKTMPILTSYPYVGVSSMLHAVWSVPCSPWLPGTHAGRRLFMHTDATTTTTATAWPALPTHMAWAHPARPPPCCPLAASWSCPARAGYKTACQRAKVTSTDELLTTGWVDLTSATDIYTVRSPACQACLPASLPACQAACLPAHCLPGCLPAGLPAPPRACAAAAFPVQL